MIRTLVVTVTALALISVAGAATGWTPKQAATLVTSSKLYGVRSVGGVVSGVGTDHVSTAQCVGAGTKSGGLFNVFSCALAWPNPNGIGQVQVSAFVRPWSQHAVCISAISLGSCPPAPPTKTLPHDPRLCGGPDFAHCVLTAANAAAAAALKTAGKPAPLVNTCKATSSWVVYVCSGATVRFVSAPSGWTTNAVVSP